jgi:hypothetical protein
MQRRHCTARPIGMARARLAEASKQLATLVGRKRKQAYVPRAGLQLV